MKKRFLFLLALVMLLASFTGCMTYEPLKITEFQSAWENVRADYPAIKSAKFEMASSGDIFISFTMSGLSEPDIFAVVNELRNVALNTEVQEKLIDGKPVGLAPDLYVSFEEASPLFGLPVKTDDRSLYRFHSTYYNEPYNSGMDPSHYTVDGYETWTGEFYESVEDAIVPTRQFTEKDIMAK